MARKMKILFYTNLVRMLGILVMLLCLPAFPFIFLFFALERVVDPINVRIKQLESEDEKCPQ